jgi:hypothetical protein
MSLSLSLSGQKEKEINVKWRNDPAELKIPDSEYMSDKKGEIIYYLSNDAGNLYVDMKIKETVQQNRLLKSGMTLWINLDGKSVKKAGVRFPVGADYSPKRKDFESQVNPPTLLSQANMIQLVGFKDIQPSRFPSDNKDNIRGRVRYDNNGDLLYSLVIPLEKLIVLKEETTETSVMNLALEIGVPPQMGSQGGMPPPSSGTGSGVSRGGSSRSGGSRGGGGAPSGGTPKAALPQTTPILIWMKELTLAKNN